MSVPPIEWMNPVIQLGTLRIAGYNLVPGEGKYFTARSRMAIEEGLRGRLPHARLSLKLDKSSPRGSLIVSVAPNDSLGKPGSFAVHDALQELYTPKVPYVGVMGLYSPTAMSDQFQVGLQVLGNPERDIVQRIGERITQIRHTTSFHADRSEQGRHFVMTVEGDWRETWPEYIRKLREVAGISCVMILNSKK